MIGSHRLWAIAACLGLALSGLSFADEPGSEGRGEIRSSSETAPWYEGIDLALSATGVLQGTGGVADGLIGDGDVVDGSASLDLELSVPVDESGSFYALFQAGTGAGVDVGAPTLSGLNADADGDANVRLSEMWYQHGWSDDRLWLRVGKIDVTTDFDTNALANSETDQFLSGGFVNSLAIGLPDDNGIGAMLWVQPGRGWLLGAGFAEADADGSRVFEDGFSILELAYAPPGEREGNYRAYGWINGRPHQSIADPAARPKSNYGFGLSLDQRLSDSTAVFARCGWQRAEVCQIGSAWSIGLQCSGVREGDTLGVAYGVAVLGDDWESSQRLLGASPADETHWELYYSLRLSEALTVTPDVQWVHNAGGDAAGGDVWAFGVRSSLCF